MHLIDYCIATISCAQSNFLTDFSSSSLLERHIICHTSSKRRLNEDFGDNYPEDPIRKLKPLRSKDR